MEYKNSGRLFILLFVFTQAFTAPADSTLSLVVSSTEPSSAKEGTSEENVLSVPKIYKMHVQSDISNRYANTTITSKVKNLANKAQEATFSVILPETAFISGFIMEVDGKNYTAYVKEKEEAKRDYDRAVAGGLGAAHVAVSARDSNRFTVSVNIEPEKKAAFYLTYEQLLKRNDGHYEQVINLHPGQPVKDLSVEVAVSESRKITNLKAPPLRSGNEIGNDKAELDPRADIEHVNDTAAVVKFTPNLERQKQLASLLGTKEDEGLSGQFVVQYDVERDPKGGEVLIQDGYFVHFFAPSELEPLPKHVVFILDTSGSMHGDKIVQLREAMLKILDQLHNNDLFNLIEFNSNAKVWDLNNPEANVWYPNNNYYWGREENDVKFDNFTFPNAYAANADNIKKAKSTISALEAGGGTEIYNALKVGLHLVELEKKQKTDDVNRQPIIIFLTDGQVGNTERIINEMSEYNSGPRKSAIFTLSFGYGADKKFLEKLALRNSGFNKHIYEAADASLQLQDFYRQISSPLLSDVTFKYEPSVTSLTKAEFPIHFGGSELVVAGRCGTPDIAPPIVDGRGLRGRVSLQPTIEHSVSNIERLWAYLTVKQLLEKKEFSDKDKDELNKKALDLALKYSFVTPVSSLVVVKPNDTNSVDTEAAEGKPQSGRFYAARGGLRRGGGVGAMHSSTSSHDSVAYSAVLPVSAYSGRQHTFTTFGKTSSEAVAEKLVPVRYFPSTTLQPSTKQTTTSTEVPNLLTVLPWLKNILNENGTLSLPSGNYKLGLTEAVSEVVTCPKTPLNSVGHCTLLHSCPQVHSLLTNVDVFVQHSCILKNEFAGICCPNSS